MKIIEIKTEEDIKRQNYNNFGKIVSSLKLTSSRSEYIFDIILKYRSKTKKTVKLRFKDFKMVKYFISKHSKVNFRNKNMNLKNIFGLLILIIVFSLPVAPVLSAEEPSQDYSVCIDSMVVAEGDASPDCNLLSIPAREVEDPFIQAISYFNSKMNVILLENIVSQYEYYDVPFYIYESFMNSVSKEEYWKECIEGFYNYSIVY